MVRGHLRGALAGSLVMPSDREWDIARQAWNLTADQLPACVVLAGSVADIATTVRFAAANGLRVAAQGTGHGASSLSGLGDTILLRTAALDGVRVDPDARTVRVQAGARWRPVIAAAAEHGLASLHGMSGGVGVAGYVLGGGIGWLARREGFASSHVRSFEVVTADGAQLTVDAEHEPELFWALRGGGGGQAIVTAFELELFELTEAFAGSIFWPIERAGELVHAYREWIATLPDNVTSFLRLIRFPRLPTVPEPLLGRALVMVALAFTGDAASGTELVAPLRTAAAPYLEMLGTMPAQALGDIAGDPQDPMPAIGRTVLLDAFGAGAVDACLELAGPAAARPPTVFEIRHLGGALRSPTVDPGAAGALEGEVLIRAGAMVPAPSARPAAVALLDAMDAALAPWTAARRTVLTFEEELPGVRHALADATVTRLTEVTALYDPAGRFLANHVVDR